MTITKNIWVTSDTHFGHDNIIKYCNRPFKDSKEMDEAILENWNSVVKPQDKIYHLGDVYFGQRHRKGENSWRHFFSRLNGHKRLVVGNHDDLKDQNLHTAFDKISMWRMFPEFGLLLTHVPVHVDTITGGVDRIDQPRLLKNIHGHTHNNGEPKNNKIKDTKNYKCVCVEQINYTPINIEELRIK